MVPPLARLPPGPVIPGPLPLDYCFVAVPEYAQSRLKLASFLAEYCSVSVTAPPAIVNVAETSVYTSCCVPWQCMLVEQFEPLPVVVVVQGIPPLPSEIPASDGYVSVELGGWQLVAPETFVQTTV